MSSRSPTPPPLCDMCESSEEEARDGALIGQFKYCADCIRDLFTSALQDPEAIPGPACDTDQKLLDIDDYSRFFDDIFVERYKQQASEWECSDQDRIYCSHPDKVDLDTTRSKFMGEREQRNDRLCRRCSICGQFVCMACGKLVGEDIGGDKDGAGGEDVEQIIDHDCNPRAEKESMAKALEGLVAGLDFQECPSCRRRGWLDDDGECQHVTCNCGTHFCYADGGDLDEDGYHFNHRHCNQCSRPERQESSDDSDVEYYEMDGHRFRNGVWDP